SPPLLSLNLSIAQASIKNRLQQVRQTSSLCICNRVFAEIHAPEAPSLHLKVISFNDKIVIKPCGTAGRGKRSAPYLLCGVCEMGSPGLAGRPKPLCRIRKT